MKTFVDYPDFTPNVSPKEMFELGVFGGTYFRDIYSGVNKRQYKNSWKEFDNWFKKLDKKKMIYSKECDININYFGEKSGTSLKSWEEKKWIHPQDPYGWVQWYCRFYKGRRMDDDRRQIDRWKGIAGKNGRFYKMLKSYPNSKKIKQLLLQWAYLKK